MKLDPFCVVNRPEGISAWNIHRVSLNRLPILNISTASNLDEWLDPHTGSQFSTRERSLHSSAQKKTKKKNNKNKDKEKNNLLIAQQDPLAALKMTLHGIFMRSSGVQGGPAKRLFSLALHEGTGAGKKKNCDLLLFVDELRFDLPCHTVLCDAFVLPLQHDLMKTIEPDFMRFVRGDVPQNMTVYAPEMKMWKQLLPALVERSRASWTHGPNCEYKSTSTSTSKIPLSTEMEQDPLCSCGRGKDVEGMMKVDSWKPLAPYVTRIALSPLFAVSYLETVVRDPEASKCFVCRGRGKPKLMVCKGCGKIRYCSVGCQKRDWEAHKKRCKA